MSESETAEPPETRAPPAMGGRIRPVLAVGASLVCTANMALPFIPLKRESPGGGTDPVGKIRSSTGTWQDWRLFHTIPTMGKFDVDLVGTTATGEVRHFGPRMPRLEPLEGASAIRYHYTFNRMLAEPGETLRASYVERAMEAIGRADPEIVEFSIRMKADVTRTLYHSRKDGKLWKEVEEIIGPFDMPADDD